MAIYFTCFTSSVTHLVSNTRAQSGVDWVLYSLLPYSTTVIIVQEPVTVIHVPISYVKCYKVGLKPTVRIIYYMAYNELYAGPNFCMKK